VNAIAITPYRDADFAAVTEIWLESSRSMGIPLPVSLDDLRARWPRELAAGWQVHIARDGGKVVGFLALKDGKVDQLFIAPDCQGRGIGKKLLDLAKMELPGGFWLTTAALGRAEKFYRREGLVRGETSRHRFGHEVVRYEWRPHR
jgi:ribosomal protein S18 acetylase RimI-like enzyme